MSTICRGRLSWLLANGGNPVDLPGAHPVVNAVEPLVEGAPADVEQLAVGVLRQDHPRLVRRPFSRTWSVLYSSTSSTAHVGSVRRPRACLLSTSLYQRRVCFVLTPAISTYSASRSGLTLLPTCVSAANCRMTTSLTRGSVRLPWSP